MSLGKLFRMKVTVFVAQFCPTLAVPWPIALEAPLPMEFSRHEYWSGLPFLFPGDLPHPGIKPADYSLLSHQGSTTAMLKRSHKKLN